MGQASIPTLNRSGYSMFWLSSWDNVHSFSSNINEDFLIREFFYFLVNDKYSAKFFKKNNLLLDFSKNQEYSISNISDKKTVDEFFFRFNKIPFYLSKIRILKFQKWVVIYFFLYNTFLKKSNINYFDYSMYGLNKSSFFFFRKKSNFIFDF